MGRPIKNSPTRTPGYWLTGGQRDNCNSNYELRRTEDGEFSFQWLASIGAGVVDSGSLQQPVEEADLHG